MASMTIKLYRGDDIRRFKFTFGDDLKENLIQIQKRVISSFGFDAFADFVVKYKDDEGDLCTVLEADELYEAVQMTKEGILRLWVFPTSSKAGKPASDPQNPSANENTSGSKDSGVPNFMEPLLKAFNVSQADIEKCFKGADMVKTLDVPISNLAQVFQRAAEDACGKPQYGQRNSERHGQRCGGRHGRCRKGNPIHWGVECDASGMNPIVGNRYHKTGQNYDLCESEFQKLDDKQKKAFELIRFPGSPPEQVVAEKLCARFIQDVTVFDGTQVLPGSTLTKIWRMKNVGKTAWPEGIVLEWVAGDNMGVSNEPVVIPSVPAGEQVDISVDLKVPSQEGRFVGYYRLRGPHGRRFGQRIWVMIHAVDKKNFDSKEVKDSDLMEFKPAKENPPVYDDVAGPDTKDENNAEDETEDVNNVAEKEEEKLPELEGEETTTQLSTSGASDDFVDVESASVLASELSEICKVEISQAEEFLTKNDPALIRAMIDNKLLRELRSAVALSTGASGPEDQENKKDDDVASVQQNDDVLSQTSSSGTDYSVGIECLKSMGFEGPNVVATLKKNHGKIEDTVKELLSHIDNE